MKNDIPITEQWLLEGQCIKCRRANYCSKDCSALKKRKAKIIAQAYEDFYRESLGKNGKNLRDNY